MLPHCLFLCSCLFVTVASWRSATPDLPLPATLGVTLCAPNSLSRMIHLGKEEKKKKSSLQTSAAAHVCYRVSACQEAVLLFYPSSHVSAPLCSLSLDFITLLWSSEPVPSACAPATTLGRGLRVCVTVQLTCWEGPTTVSVSKWGFINWITGFAPDSLIP